MTDLALSSMDDFSAAMRQVIVETVPGMIHAAIIDTVPDMIREAIKRDVPKMIRDEVSDKISGMQAEISTQGMLLRSVASDVSSLKNQTRKLGILYEDLESRFDTVIELIESDSDTRAQVKDHETRITALESGQAQITRRLP